mgnify:CR=1 FL=1
MPNNLLNFLKGLIQGASKKIYLIVDNLRVNYCKIIKDLVFEPRELIDLFYLPSYVP